MSECIHVSFSYEVGHHRIVVESKVRDRGRSFTACDPSVNAQRTVGMVIRKL